MKRRAARQRARRRVHRMTTLALAAAALSGCAAGGHEYRWDRAVVVEPAEVAITVAEVAPSEMRRVKRKYEGGGPSRERGLASARNHVGFAVLWRSDEAYRCTVYVLDANDAETIEHERRHCYGWVH